MKIVPSLLLLTLSYSLSQSIYAIESPWFEIEILVFEQANVTRLKAENWDQQLSLIDTKGSRDFITLSPSLVALNQICLKGKLLDVKEKVAFNLLEPEVFVDSELVDSKLVESAMIEEKPFQILAREFNQLNDLETTLKRRHGFRSLMHMTWRQPVESRENSKPTRLYAGKNYSHTYNPQGDARVDIASYNPEEDEQESAISAISLSDGFSDGFSDDEATLTIQEAGIQLDSNELNKQKRLQYFNDCSQLQQQQSDKRNQDVWEVDGNIRLYVKRYLHLETDLILRLPGKVDIQLGALEMSLAADRLLNTLDTEQDNSQDGFGWQLGDNFLDENYDTSIIQRDILNKYAMVQSRRIRSGEIHYFDHPLFGVLVQIRPYDKDAEKELEDDNKVADNN